ncbi:MAG: Kazal-type serine protease inhibitor domain-containing protein [Myxococcales bacterium]
MLRSVSLAPRFAPLLLALGLVGPLGACDSGSSSGALDPDAAADALRGSAKHDAGTTGDGDGDGDDGTAGDGDDTSSNGDAGGSGMRCGTRGGVTCAKDEFCSYAASSQCGANDQGGTCTKKPQICTTIYAPVCGCDGKTYASDCSAQAAGQSVKAQGECGTAGNTGKTCGGFAGLSCEAGQFCNYEEAAGGQGCGIADGTGVCTDKPKLCGKDYNPVCGCDGETYNSRCLAQLKGVSIASEGACK